MNFPAFIEAKRDGERLSTKQIQEIVQAFTRGSIPDYQMAAFLMAVFFQGLDQGEQRTLTLAMRDSGRSLSFPEDPRPLVDKHSTGGVGDKASLVLAPLLAALGFRVPMISGRALGITGGTLDKLESIPGFQTRLEPERIVEIVQETGCVICGQTETMVPADKAIYALRDATGTVPSIPLITASILSKKLSEGIGALLLDVKFGSGAFMADPDRARGLAHALVSLGRECGVNTRALLTDMNAPLGRSAGNWLEVREAAESLACRGPEDLEELVVECAAHLLLQTGKSEDLDQARQQALTCLASGKPAETWESMLQAQGADLEAYREKLREDHTAPVVLDLEVPDEGFIARCDARIIGEVVRDLGGGRRHKDAAIDHDVGIDELARPGEPFGVACSVARIHAATESAAQDAAERLRQAFGFADDPVDTPPLIREIVD